MNKNNLKLGLVPWVAWAGVVSAQPPGITFEEIARELPREGAPLGHRAGPRRAVVLHRVHRDVGIPRGMTG